MVLLVVCLASLMIVADVAMLNVALPSIAHAFAFTAGEQQWFVSFYTLSFAALTLAAGRLADVLGHRRVFLGGLVVFTSGAAVCAAARGVAVVETARAVQCVGAAVLSSTTLSLLTSTYTDPTARRRALGIWAATVSGGAAAGVLLGGALTSVVSWRWVFVVGAALGTADLLLTTARLPEPAIAARARHLDGTGALLASGGLFTLVLAATTSRQHGWLSTPTLALLAGGALLVLAFLGHERRTPDPLLPAALLRDRRRAAGLVVSMLVGCELFFLYFAVSVFLQRVQGRSALGAGVGSLPAALAVVTGSLAAARLVARVPARRHLLGSLTLLAVGFLWLSRLQPTGAYWPHLGLPLVVVGLGLGTSFVPVTLLITSGAGAARAGVASGLVTASQHLGGALGLATLSTLVLSGLRAAHPAAAISSGAETAFLVCAAGSVVGALVVAALVPATAPRLIDLTVPVPSQGGGDLTTAARP